MKLSLGLKPEGFVVGSIRLVGLKKLRNPPSDWLPTKKGIRLQMDWQGQKVAEQMMQIMLVGLAVMAFGSGYIMGSIEMMILIYAAGVVLTTLVTLPNWPPFNRRPLKWLDPSEAEKHPKPQQSVKK